VSPELVVALGLGETRRYFSTVEEVAHDAIRDGPVVAIHTVMMRAKAGISREL
jgi:hypothetical protein